MNKLKALLGLSLAALLLVAAAPANIQNIMHAHLITVESVFQYMYAPTEWKERFAQINITEVFETARKEIDAKSSNIKVSDYQSIIYQALLKLQDYHVGIGFERSEISNLPFRVKSVGDKYIVTYIDTDKLGSVHFPFSRGAELISIDGVPAKDLAEEIRIKTGGNVFETDKSIADILLTVRPSYTGTIPRGPVEVVLNQGGIEKAVQLIWDYTEEVVKDHSTIKLSTAGKPSKLKIKVPMMIPGQYDFFKSLNDIKENPFNIGSKGGMLPNLGTVIWENPSDNKFRAYIYMTPDRKLIGFVRIPSYGADGTYTEEMIEILTRFEEITDGLVIDETNNPGGSVFYLYSLVSLLSDKPMYTPKHRMRITQSDVLDAYKTVKEIETIDSDEKAVAAFGSEIHGLPVSLQTAIFFKEYYKFIISQWEEGKSLTDPYYLGIDKINPHPAVNYSKPVLVLVNELCFSGGDFFPAILQDNKRVTVMGTRTAGAGGYVNSIEIPNLVGVRSISFTGSIAERINKNPIENLGVTPDIQYTLSENDLSGNMTDYVAAINKEMDTLIGTVTPATETTSKEEPAMEPSQQK